MTTWNHLTPAELLEATGQVGPPVRLWTIIKHFDLPHRFRQGIDAEVERDGPGFRIVIPEGVTANNPAVRLSIAHDLRQLQLGEAGRSSDLALAWQREQEDAFDAWGRELLLPAAWFRQDAMKPKTQRLTVKQLASSYNVQPFDVIDRGQDLELTHLICRDKESYRIYRQHPYWKKQRLPSYFATHRICEHMSNGQKCGSLAAVLHHLSYERLGRELDQDLRALCWEHHRLNHRGDDGQIALF